MFGWTPSTFRKLKTTTTSNGEWAVIEIVQTCFAKFVLCLCGILQTGLHNSVWPLDKNTRHQRKFFFYLVFTTCFGNLLGLGRGFPFL